MSKVKIQGNASGTGVVTLTAPNTNTDRTITLPDDTQTLIGTNASGNVGIGTASPSGLLHISGSTTTTLPSIVLERTGSGSSKWDIKPYADTLTFRADATTDRLTLTNDGLTFNGDTAAANALDDYEEGTFTVTPSDAPSGGNNGSFASGFASYIKIGKQVTVWIQGTNIDTSGMVGSNIVYFKGLPFTVDLHAVGAITGRFDSTSAIHNATHAVSDYFNIIEHRDANNEAIITTSDFISGAGDIEVTLTYMAV